MGHVCGTSFSTPARRECRVSRGYRRQTGAATGRQAPLVAGASPGRVWRIRHHHTGEDPAASHHYCIAWDAVGRGTASPFWSGAVSCHLAETTREALTSPPACWAPSTCIRPGIELHCGKRRALCGNSCGTPGDRALHRDPVVSNSCCGKLHGLCVLVSAT